ncbi:cyanophycinase [Pedobacter steynii]|uniref:Cyanophycinase n=1 Tax=Pedobacter steynii TaxID=430522 RepID=A0A1H0EZS4_9SPHI|nr:cyanophycinase [Pedobacter steynii]NQX42254.1 cyanophycinase [Pedobacter steynii]SDN87892.1 cyanophycinase [Pedobacter steynii]
MTPKGKLIIIGGAINTGSFTETTFGLPQNMNFFERGILKKITTESLKGTASRFEIITTASLVPERVGEEYIKAFGQLDVQDVGVLNINSREQANSEENSGRVKAADVIIFTGGDQLRLSSIFGGTAIHQILLDKYQDEPVVIAGTSAGAAASSKNMIYQGSSKDALLKGEVKITGGLGFIDGVIVDTHFVQRGRIGRLLYATASNPGILGIGLGEDTGLYISNGNIMEAIGSGMVILVDGRNMADTNLTDVDMGQPVSINNMTVHVMCDGDIYDLTAHKLTIHHPKVVPID